MGVCTVLAIPICCRRGCVSALGVVLKGMDGVIFNQDFGIQIKD